MQYLSREDLLFLVKQLDRKPIFQLFLIYISGFVSEASVIWKD